MFLLLGITLIPLIGVGIFYQVSFRITSKKVSGDIYRILDQNARSSMRRVLKDFDNIIKIKANFLESLVEIQRIEIEHMLEMNFPPLKLRPGEKVIGFNKTIGNPEFPPHPYLIYEENGEKKPLPVDFHGQSLFVTRGVSRSRISRDAARLAKITNLYHHLYFMDPKLIQWQYTALESGLLATFPAGNTLPEDYDPRKQKWYTGAKKNKALFWTYPYLDTSTRALLITISAPLYGPDSSFKGVTALDILVPQIFRWSKLDSNWAEGAKAFLISPTDNTSKDSLLIFAGMEYETDMQSWEIPLNHEVLSSRDSVQFRQLVSDMVAGKSGIMKMRYKGKKALWVYRGFSKKQIYPLLIIPYDNVVSFARETENFILSSNTQWIGYSIIFVLLVGITAVLIAVQRSESFTRPIRKLTSISRELAEGNFNARVEITTADELEQLGNVFNQIGPRLLEREEMKHSLEAARTIQQKLLPAEAPQIKYFEISGLCHYSDETGGDYFDFIPAASEKENKLIVALGDVTGHGIGAALLMATARTILRSSIRQFPGDLSAALAETNNQLAADTDPDKFMTLYCFALDEETGEVNWAGGGHDPAIWYRKERNGFQELDSDGIPLGFMKGMDFPLSGPVKPERGDVLVIGTDGIWEAENRQEEMFGKERLKEIIARNAGKNAREIGESIILRVNEFCGDAPQQDDITVVVIKTV